MVKNILVVDDDGDLGEFVQTMLIDAGFAVGCVDNGPDALAFLWSHRIDLLITDLVMPRGLDGFQLGILARTQQPGLKVIYMSGYEPEIYRSDFRTEEFIAKPFQPHELLGCIYEMIGRGPERLIPPLDQAAAPRDLASALAAE